MTNIQQWTNNQRVKGSYYGIAFTGTINDNSSRRAPRGNTFIFAVDLDQPITLNGYTRTDVIIWSNCEFSSLELA